MTENIKIKDHILLQHITGLTRHHSGLESNWIHKVILLISLFSRLFSRVWYWSKTEVIHYFFIQIPRLCYWLIFFTDEVNVCSRIWPQSHIKTEECNDYKRWRISLINKLLTSFGKYKSVDVSLHHQWPVVRTKTANGGKGWPGSSNANQTTCYVSLFKYKNWNVKSLFYGLVYLGWALQGLIWGFLPL